MESRDTFSYTIRVQADEIDELGHVNNTFYLRYAEDVARAHSDALGLTLTGYQTLGVVPVVRRHTITYYQSAVLGDSLRVTTHVEAFRGARAGRTTRLERVDGLLLAEVVTEWVWITATTGRPTRVPSKVLDAFGLREAAPGPSAKQPPKQSSKLPPETPPET